MQNEKSVSECIDCGMEFHNPGRRCNSCRNKRWKLNNRQKDLEQRRTYNKRRWSQIKPKPVRKHCELCDKVFTANIKTPQQQFCSSKCRTAAYRMANRHKIIEWRKNMSEEAKEAKRISDMKYKNHKRYGGNKYKCFERDGYKCTNCGRTNEETILVPHHIDWSGQTENPNNSLDNLTTLCKKCHIKIHPPNGVRP